MPRLAAQADCHDEEFFGTLPPALRRTIETALKGIVRRHDLKTVPMA